MFGGHEWIIIVLVIVLLFGASAIPKIARSIGKAKKEFKEGMKEAEEADEKDDAPAEDKASKE